MMGNETETEELDSVEKRRTNKVVPSLKSSTFDQRDAKSQDAPELSALFHCLSTAKRPNPSPYHYTQP